MPTRCVSLTTLFDSLIPGVSVDIRLLAMQQRLGNGDVVHIGRRSNDGMNQSGVCVHADVRFHSEVPVAAFLRRVHFWIPGAGTVLCGTRRGSQGGVDCGSSP
jgi:hypothetical protein